MCMQLFLVPHIVQSKPAHRSLMSCELLAVPAVEAWRRQGRLDTAEKGQGGRCIRKHPQQHFTLLSLELVSEKSCQVY